jgi:hypothetical protein
LVDFGTDFTCKQIPPLTLSDLSSCFLLEADHGGHGLKRKAARRDLPRKKRSSLSSTVASRMFAEQAMMEQFQH